MDLRPVSQVLGILLLFLAAFMLVHVGLGLLWDEPRAAMALLYGFGATTASGLALLLVGGAGRRRANMRQRDAFFVVSVAWVLIGLYGALPFVFSGWFGTFTDSVFESVSGFTTTGSSILADIEAVPHSLLMWRATTHWIGGLGIVLLTVAILPFLGVAGMQLARAEGLSSEKLQPRIRQTAQALWRTYLVLTLAEVVLLRLAGMNFFDAIAHTFATVATGGFSTKNKSVESFNSPTIEAIIVVFMFLSAANFALHFRLVRSEPGAAGSRRSAWRTLRAGLGGYLRDPEFRLYTYTALGASALVVASLLWGGFEPWPAFRYGVFNVVSIMTTTGFSNSDFGAWVGVQALAPFILFLLMIIGGSTGSTSGAIKIARVWVALKDGARELYQQIHPKAVTQIRLGKEALAPSLVRSVSAFVVLYLSTIAAGAVILSVTGVDFVSSVTASATCLGGVGPGLGVVGPAHNFAGLTDVAKWTLILIMLLGRVELYTMLVLLLPSYWRR